MSWDAIINQDRVIRSLTRAVERDRIAHSLLFNGPLGVGKRAVALEYAKVLQCEREQPEACGSCIGCTKVARGVHPDIHILLPHPSDVDEEEIGERIRLLSRRPYAETDFTRRPSLSDPTESSNKQSIYRVDRIRELQQTLSYKTHEGRYKVAIMTEADRMRTEAANAFLKLLEEPTPRTVLILTTHRPDQLLPTILSRCQQLRFEPLTPEEIAAGLAEREGIDEDAASTLAHMADGSFTRALELLENEQLQENRQRVLDFFRQSYLMDVDAVLDLVGEAAQAGREPVKGLLRLMLTWLRDLVLYRSTGSADLVVNVDQREAIGQFCENMPEARIEEMIDLVEQALHLVRRNAQTELVLLVLAQQIHKLMRGQSVGGRLVVPLDRTDSFAPTRANASSSSSHAPSR